MTPADLQKARETLERLNRALEWLRASGACQVSPTARRSLKDAEAEAAKLGVMLGVDPVVEEVAKLRLIQGGRR